MKYYTDARAGARRCASKCDSYIHVSSATELLVFESQGALTQSQDEEDEKNSQPESHITVCYISQHTQNETWQTVFLLFQSCRAASASTLIELHSSCFQICLRATERTIYNLIRFFFCFVFLSRWCDRETMLFGCDVNTTLNMNFNKSATTKYEVVYRTSKANEPEEKTSKKRTHKKRRRQNHQSS